MSIKEKQSKEYELLKNLYGPGDSYERVERSKFAPKTSFITESPGGYRTSDLANLMYAVDFRNWLDSLSSNSSKPAPSPNPPSTPTPPPVIAKSF